MAENLYKYIIARCKEHIDIVQQGEFGADMKVELVNDGPFTVILDSNELQLPVIVQYFTADCRMIIIICDKKKIMDTEKKQL